jgi:hypothetical protein
MYIPIKNVKMNRNLQCKRKYNYTISQSLLLNSSRQTLTVYKEKVMLCQQISMKLSKLSSKTAVILFSY